MNPKCFHNKITRSFLLFQFCCLNTKKFPPLPAVQSLNLGFSCLFPAAWHHHGFLFSSNSNYLGSSILHLFWNTVLEVIIHFLSSPIFKYIFTLLRNLASLSHNPTLVTDLRMGKSSWVMTITSNRIMELLRLEKPFKITSITGSLFLCPFWIPGWLKETNFSETFQSLLVHPLLNLEIQFGT